MTTRRRGARGSMPAGAIVVVALAITAVVGVIAGAVWGQIGPGGPSASSSTGPTSTAPAGDTASAPPSDTGAPSPTISDATSASSGSPAVSPTGAAPSAPATTTTSADSWRLGSWKITTTGGTLGVDTSARNTATGTRSATLVLYVYVNNTLIATTTAVVTDVPAGGTVAVHFAGTDPWQPGQKVLLLATA